MAAKKCHNCRKTLDESFFTDDKGKILSKCNNCRVKLFKTSNTCNVCGIRALFNFEGQTDGIKCKKHKDISMINIKTKNNTKKCQFLNCKKIPNFNFEGETLAKFCCQHKEANMINIKTKKCNFQSCKKIPNFNFEGEITGKFCSEHKEPNMIDIKHKTCLFQNCKRQPAFNFEGEKHRKFCSDHKLPNMVNIKHKKCNFLNCKKLPIFNFKDELIPIFCNEHKKNDMIDIKHSKCNICKIRANYNLPGMMPNFCSKHKKEGMISNPTKRCTSKDCKETATHGIKSQLFCETHAPKDHYNLCERKCTNPKCPEPNRLDILNKEGLCVTFCSLIKQDQMMKKHIKKKEEFIGKLLEEEVKQELSHRDEVIDSSCSKNRPDFVYDCGAYFVIIEVDEHQHKSYKNCGTTKDERHKMENKRMFMIFQSFGGPKTIFIRYNPDSFCVNNKVVTVGDKKRHECLLRWVKHYIKNGSENSLEVKYLFYDDYNEGNQETIIIDEKDVL